MLKSYPLCCSVNWGTFPNSSFKDFRVVILLVMPNKVQKKIPINSKLKILNRILFLICDESTRIWAKIYIKYGSYKSFLNEFFYLQFTASSWLNDLCDQVEQTRVLNVVFRSATALGSRLPSMANARAKVAGAGAMLRPVSSSTQVNSFFILVDVWKV